LNLKNIEKIAGTSAGLINRPGGRKPSWLNKKVDLGKCGKVKALLRGLNLHTVCEEAKCPNISECFSRRTAAFLILGKICTRSCKFCGISKGRPLLPSFDEPEKIAWAVEKLELNYVVITSVTRDDLEDKGVFQFVRCIQEIRKIKPDTKIEILIPDFGGDSDLLKDLVKSCPFVINHNLETVKRLYPLLRKEADYSRSLRVLGQIKKINPAIFTKSGIMLGLGETDKEVLSLFKDLRNVNCDFLTIGQYLQPSLNHFPVKEYIPPERFDHYRDTALSMGFRTVVSSPYTRSSYKAGDYNI